MARKFLPTNRKSVDYEVALAFGLFYSHSCNFFVYIPERRAPQSWSGLSGFLFNTKRGQIAWSY